MICDICTKDENRPKTKEKSSKQFWRLLLNVVRGGALPEGHLSLFISSFCRYSCSCLNVLASFTVGRLFASILVNINSAMRRVRDVINMVYNRLTTNGKLLTFNL